ncbi:hypothetical protein Pyn_10461 [Prunus yedoensis var. nudiflora]|uniref:Uncharacterized protein n=1 Tax=Prunus yedoensis var. nudiflora TaxID=2094558 RepID=A0A314ZQ63_PRUYE|nr:hypothetical protein Pyn_10461 [Prunus yedoensis var. nudiflora]
MLKLGNYQQGRMEGHPPVGSKKKGKEIKIERGIEKKQQTRREIKISRRRKQYKIKMANDDEAGPSSRCNPILGYKQLLPHHQEIDELVTEKEFMNFFSHHLLGPCMDDKSSLTSSSEDYLRLKTP